MELNLEHNILLHFMLNGMPEILGPEYSISEQVLITIISLLLMKVEVLILFSQLELVPEIED